MPLTSLKLLPGINSVKTPTLNEGGWSAAQNIRFFEGLPQKNGGFTAFCQAGGGTVHDLRAWTALSGISYLAIGSQLRLSVFTGGVVTDITPLTGGDVLPVSVSTVAGSDVFTIAGTHPSVGDWFLFEAPISVGGVVLSGSYGVTATVVGPPANFSFVGAQQAVTTVVGGGAAREISTMAASPRVAVSFPNHGLTTGGVAEFLNPVAVGGITLMGGYVVQVVDANNYTFMAASPATATATVAESGGMIALSFYGVPSSGGLDDLPAAQFSLANWGEFLMACPEGAAVYVWMPAKGVATPAQWIETAPPSNTLIFVAIQAQQLVCCGTVNSATGLFDAMLLAWSNTGDYTVFTPLATNAAGSFRLSIGSKIVAAEPVAGQNLIWTDLALYSMQYISPPLVWGFQPLGVNCGAVSSNSVAIINDQIVWMSQNQFMTLGPAGTPVPIPCTVWDQVFPNIDRGNLGLVTCLTNSYFNEVSWSVPQVGGAPSVLARVQLDSGAWTIDQYAYTAAFDQSVFGPPLVATASGAVMQLETTDDAAGAALPVSLTSGAVMIAEGEESTFISEVIPDIKFGHDGNGEGTVMMSIAYYDYPAATPRIAGPVAITKDTLSLPGLRGRGRQLQCTFMADDVGAWWRLGNMRYRGQTDGKR